jgi:succinate dehydrogenase/fumarate reductase flavoprotein subunit
VFDAPEGWELQNMLTLGRLITQAALARTESRGTHARSDFPGMADSLRCHLLWRCGMPAPARAEVGALGTLSPIA